MAREYKYECVKEDSKWVAYVYIDGNASLRQEHDHRLFGNVVFATEADAIEWAESWIANELKTAEKAEIGALAIMADEELDRAYKEATILQTIIMTENL